MAMSAAASTPLPAAAAAAAAAAASSPVYTFFGHGAELIEDEIVNGTLIQKEITLPAGYTLVLTEECGAYGSLPPNVYDVMADPANLVFFQNPVEHLEKVSQLLKKNVQVFVGPTKIPNFSFMFLNTDVGEEEDDLFQSGVHPLPLKNVAAGSYGAGSHTSIPKTSVRYKKIAPYFENAAFPPFKQIVKSIVEELSGQTYPSWKSMHADQKGETLDNLPIRLLKTKLDYFISDVFKSLGPGVYYNCLCRSIFSSYNPTNVVAVDKNTWNEPSYVVRKLAFKNTPLTAEESTILAKSKSILASRKSKSLRVVSDLPKYMSLLEIFSTKTVDEKTLLAALRVVQEMPLEKINTLESPHTGYRLAHLAARTNDTRLLALLLERGADMTVQNDEGGTPMHMACQEKSVSAGLLILAALVSTPRAVAIKDESEQTVLMAACDHNLPVLVNTLCNDFEKYVDYKAVDGDGDTALHLACAEDADVCTAIIIKKHPELLAIKNKKGRTPWDLAVKNQAGLCLEVIHRFAPSFAVPKRMSVFLDEFPIKSKESLEAGVETLLRIGVIPTQDDLDTVVDHSTKSAIVIFDKLWADGLISRASNYTRVTSDKIKPFADHVKRALDEYAATAAAAAATTATAAAKTKKNRRAGRRTRKRSNNK
jgi:ankyrin repeat protein